MSGQSLPDIPYGDLAGLRVLVVEDEAMVSVMLEDMLEEFGCVVAGVAGTIAAALRQIDAAEQIDAAILDVNLGGEKVFPVADVLIDRKVPVVFSTGYGPAELVQRYPDSQLLNKPYAPDTLARVLGKVAAGSRH